MLTREMMELGEKQARFDYQVASGSTPEELRASVMRLVEAGYRPIGGVAVERFLVGFYRRTDSALVQAMVRE